LKKYLFKPQVYLPISGILLIVFCNICLNISLLGSKEIAVKSDLSDKDYNITIQKINYVFPNTLYLTDIQIKKVEIVINQKIAAKLPVTSQTMTKQKALKIVTVAMFANRYPDVVTVYSIGNYSKEICAGPHVTNTVQIGKIKITRQQSVGANIRRVYLELIPHESK